MNQTKILNHILHDLSIYNYKNLLQIQRASGETTLQIKKPEGKFYHLTYDNDGKPLSIGSYNLNGILDEAAQNQIATQLKVLDEVFKRDGAAMSKANKQAFFTSIFGKDCVTLDEN